MNATVPVSPSCIAAIARMRRTRTSITFVPANRSRLVAVAYDDDGSSWPTSVYADGSTARASMAQLDLVPLAHL